MPIIEKLKEFLDPAIKWVESTFPFTQGWGLWVIVGAAVLVLIIIIIIICCIAKSAKKKKKAKMSKAQENSVKILEEVVEQDVKDDNPAIEEEPVEEVQEEVVEETPVEEVPEEEPATEEPATEEPEEEEVEVEVVEDEPVEEVPVVEEKPAPKKEVKKAPVAKEVKEEPKAKAAPKKSREKKSADDDDVVVTSIYDQGVKEPEPAKEEKPVEEEKPVKKEPVKKAAKAAPAEEKKSSVGGKFILVPEGTNWRYKLLASNGEILIVSEPYTSEKSVRTGIETLKKNLDNSKIEFVEDKHGLHYFMIKTMQGRIQATSASYKTKASATNASKSYVRWAQTDNIVLQEEGDSEHTEVEKIDVQVEEENTGKFVIKKEGNDFIYQLVAANGVVVATSPAYKSKDSCLEACETFRRCVYKGDFLVSKDKNSLYQFKLYNKQNRLVLAGEVYKERSRVISVLEAIKRLSKLAEVVDTTK